MAMLEGNHVLNINFVDSQHGDHANYRLQHTDTQTHPYTHTHTRTLGCWL